MFTAITPPFHPNHRARWVGYLIRQERQRKEKTQGNLARELGFSISTISNIESGLAYANVQRTSCVLHQLGVSPYSIIESIAAQQRIHVMLRSDPQIRAALSSMKHRAWHQSKPSYQPVVADKAYDTPDQSRGSS